MIHKFSLALLAIVGLPLSGQCQEDQKPIPVQIRAVLHDPVNPIADLFYTDEKGLVNPLEFRPHDLTRPVLMLPVNGSLVLYDKAEIDPENPAASVAASTKLPQGIRRAMVVVVPAPEGDKDAYRMLVIDDSEKAFPKGESRVLALIGVEIAIEAGEHKLPAQPGKITRIPPVRKVNDFNMAQTNFYYKRADTWIPFTERQLQYIDASRRLFIVHATPGALAPTVSTIVDTSLPSSAP